MKILDGTGKGFKAKVDKENRLATTSVTSTTEHHANTEGRAFSVLIQQTPTGACDFFFHLKNNEDVDLTIEGFDYRTASAESIDIILCATGTPAGTSCITPANLNGGSSAILCADVFGGNNITGLSGGSVIYRIYMTSTSTVQYNFEQDIILPKGTSLTFLANTGGVQIDINVNLNIREIV